MPWDDDLDAASIMVRVDLVATAGAISSITANGVSLAEDTTAAWVAGTTYATGARVHSATTRRVYESLKDSNTGKDPTLIANQVNAQGVGTWWFDVGPTNRVAMFDGLVNTQTVADSPLVITLKPGAFNGFALLGIDADTLAVTVKDATGGTTVWTAPPAALEGSAPPDYYEYFFDRFKPLTRYVATNIPAYGTAEMTITLTKATGSVRLGMLAVGDLRPIGIPQRDASVEPMDYSYVKTDAFGNTTVKKRNFATGMAISCKMDREDANAVLDTVQQVLGTPAVVIGSAAALYEWMTVFGLISARLSPADFPYVTINVNVRGLI